MTWAAVAAAVGCGGGSTSSDVGNATAKKKRDYALVEAFTCQTARPFYDGKVHTLRFSVEHLADPEQTDLVWPDELDALAIEVDPEDSFLVGLNENNTITLEDGKLFISGDSDGFYWSHLVLFENSGLTKGYVRLEDNVGEDGDGGFIGGGKYSEVWCTLEAVEGK
jgi:hypothetical protein